MKRSLMAAVGVLVAWMLLDLIAHRCVLAPIYEATASLWRPFDQMNVVLIYTVTVVLIGIFIGIYSLLVRPKSLRAGIVLGVFLAWPWGSRLDSAPSFTCRFRFRWRGAGSSLGG